MTKASPTMCTGQGASNKDVSTCGHEHCSKDRARVSQGLLGGTFQR